MTELKFQTRIEVEDLRILSGEILSKSRCDIDNDLITVFYWDEGISLQGILSCDDLKYIVIVTVEVGEYSDFLTWLYHNAWEENNIFAGSTGKFTAFYQCDKDDYLITKDFGQLDSIMRLSIIDGEIEITQVCKVDKVVQMAIENVIETERG